MKIITKEWLEEKRACAAVMRWFLAQDETDTAKLMGKLVEEKRYNDALWILKNVSSTEQLCRVAVFSAKQVLPIYEAYGSNDALRKAIAAAELATANPTEENKRAARAAAEAAAEAAARAADDAAVYAAYAADCAADCAAAEAAADAARKEMQRKIINYAIEICGL